MIVRKLLGYTLSESRALYLTLRGRGTNLFAERETRLVVRDTETSTFLAFLSLGGSFSWRAMSTLLAVLVLVQTTSAFFLV